MRLLWIFTCFWCLSLVPPVTNAVKCKIVRNGILMETKSICISKNDKIEIQINGDPNLTYLTNAFTVEYYSMANMTNGEKPLSSKKVPVPNPTKIVFDIKSIIDETTYKLKDVYKIEIILDPIRSRNQTGAIENLQIHKAKRTLEFIVNYD